MLNMPGYKDEKSNAIGSVHDYFLDQSNGTFDLSFDVVGPVTLPQPSEFYGGRTEESNDKNPAQMIIDACNAVKGQVNFADYDWDGDKEVEQVMCFMPVRVRQRVVIRTPSGPISSR